MDNHLVFLFVITFAIGACCGYMVGYDAGMERHQKEAVAVGAGKFKTEANAIKFEWIKTP